MANKFYDATKEFAPFERTGLVGHPRPRKGKTARKRRRAGGQ